MDDEVQTEELVLWRAWLFVFVLITSQFISVDISFWLCAVLTYLSIYLFTTG
jgi:hypothetical protein